MPADGVGIIGDTHEPFTHKHYKDFCYQTFKKFKVGQVVHIGDVVDNHAISFHEHHPDGHSPLEEMERARKELKEWFKVFPKVKVCKGNHDLLSVRKAISHGLPSSLLRHYREVWDFPKGWEYEWNYYICGVKYEHGTGYSGEYGHMAAAKANRQSTVIGHIHSAGGVNYTANDLNRIFGLAVGCGIDRMQYAFWYGRDFKHKPILGCGVVLGGKEAHFVPMKI